MPTTMQSVVKAKAGPGIELREVPVPTPGPGKVLVRVQPPVSAEPISTSSTGFPGQGPNPSAAYSRS